MVRQNVLWFERFSPKIRDIEKILLLIFSPFMYFSFFLEPTTPSPCVSASMPSESTISDCADEKCAKVKCAKISLVLEIN